MEELRFKRVPHSPFSSQIAPSDFFLFRWLNGEQLSEISWELDRKIGTSY
jgi:hypothetical protein